MTCSQIENCLLKAALSVALSIGDAILACGFEKVCNGNGCRCQKGNLSAKERDPAMKVKVTTNRELISRLVQIHNSYKYEDGKSILRLYLANLT